jgi:hypothetical protein
MTLKKGEPAVELLRNGLGALLPPWRRNKVETETVPTIAQEEQRLERLVAERREELARAKEDEKAILQARNKARAELASTDALWPAARQRVNHAVQLHAEAVMALKRLRGEERTHE